MNNCPCDFMGSNICVECSESKALGWFHQITEIQDALTYARVSPEQRNLFFKSLKENKK